MPKFEIFNSKENSKIIRLALKENASGVHVITCDEHGNEEYTLASFLSDGIRVHGGLLMNKSDIPVTERGYVKITNLDSYKG